MEKPLDAIILENARSCNLRCRACPTTYTKDYPAGFMSMETFRRIVAHISPTIFPKCGLTGWGETFLDPTYFDKLAILKSAGYYVGGTSNATLLDRELTCRLIDQGLDLLCLSIDLFHLKAGNRTISELAERLSQALQPLAVNPALLSLGMNIVVARSGRDFLFELLQMTAELPFRNVSVIPLIMIPTRDLYSELMSATELAELKARCEATFPDRNLAFAYLDPAPAGNCRSDVHQNVYVSYDGRVSPCCVLAMEFPNICFPGDLHRTEKLHFGDLTEQPFPEIWESDAYRSFRRQFQNGTIPVNCSCCNAWRRLPDEPIDHAD